MIEATATSNNHTVDARMPGKYLNSNHSNINNNISVVSIDDAHMQSNVN